MVCDVVFLLSAPSQFFDSQDISLFSEQIPQEGISRVIVIGSKFDNGLIGESQKYNNDIKTAQVGVKNVLNEQFKARIKDSQRQNIRDMFENAFPPNYVSSSCYDIYKHYGNLSKNEERIKNNIIRAFPHFLDDAEKFKELSGIEIFNSDIIPKIVSEKKKIFEERSNNAYSGFMDKFTSSIEELDKSVKDKQEKLSNGDIKSLEDKVKSTLNNLEKLKHNINDCYDEKTHEVKSKFNDLLTEINDIIDMNSEVKKREKTEDYTVMVEKDGILDRNKIEKDKVYIYLEMKEEKRYSIRSGEYELSKKESDDMAAIGIIGKVLRESDITEKKEEESTIDGKQNAFFRGSIRFLFQDENGQVDWRRFDEKWKHAKNFFLQMPTQATAMQERYRNADLLKSMMSWFTSEAFQKVLWWKHRTFNNKPETWLYYLLNNDNCKAIHHLMLGETNTPDTFEKSSDFNERTVYILATTSLLDFVITHIPSSWIRNYHNHIAIFPSGKGIFLNAEKRDGLLSSTEQIGIREEHIIPETTLLYGSDINFTFNNHNFQWYRNDFVYIMDEYWNYAIKDEKAQEEMDKYYCRSTRDIQDSTGLIQMLTEFINIYSNKLL